MSGTREEIRVVNRNGTGPTISFAGYVIDAEATARLRDEMYPALAPHRAERRVVTTGEWVPVPAGSDGEDRPANPDPETDT